VKPTRRNRRARACTRYVSVRGGVTKAFAAGSRAVRFTGRMNNKRLKVGRYRLRLRATDAAGNSSRTVYKQFRIRKRAR